MQDLLDEADATLLRQGDNPRTRGEDTIKTTFGTCLRFLDALKTRAGTEDGAAAKWLKAQLTPLLEQLPENRRKTPDGATSNYCLRTVYAALGLKAYAIPTAVKQLIHRLSDVDLRFRNPDNTSLVPAVDNPIPNTGKGTALHARFDMLKVEANKTAFSEFFKQRDKVPVTADKEGATHYARQVTYPMMLLECLESRTKDGRPAPREIGSVLKEAFSSALNQTVTNWNDVLQLPSMDQRRKIRAELAHALEINPKAMKYYLHFITFQTGIPLWTGNDPQTM